MFNVVLCPKCGMHQVTKRTTSMKCVYCGKSSNLKIREFSRIIKKVESSRQAGKIAASLNDKRK